MPEKDRPEDWKPSWVGRYKITSGLPYPKYTLPTPIPWTQCVKGEGNLRQITFPDFALPQGLQQRYKRRQTTLRKDPKQIRGRTCQVIYLRARKAGTYKLPALSLPHYNPWQQRYVTAKAKPISFTVVGTPALGQRNNNKQKPKNTVLTNPQDPASSKHRLGGQSSVWFVSVGLGLLLLLGLGWIVQKRTKTTEIVEKDELIYPPTIESVDALQRWLAQRSQQVEPSDLKRLESLLYQWLDGYLQKPSRALSLDRLVHQLNQQGMMPAVSQGLRDVLQQCHQLRFSPTVTRQSSAELLETLRQLLPQLPS